MSAYLPSLAGATSTQVRNVCSGTYPHVGMYSTRACNAEPDEAPSSVPTSRWYAVYSCMPGFRKPGRTAYASIASHSATRLSCRGICC